MSGLALLAVEDAPVTLNAAGAMIMTLSIGLVLGLAGFCFWRILREPRPSGHHQAPLEVAPRDDQE